MAETSDRATAIQQAMLDQHLSQAQLAEMARVDPGTLSDFLAGRRSPRAKTVAKLEDALGLTRGIPEASAPEDPTPASALLEEATEEELVAALLAKIGRSRARLRELEQLQPSGVSSGEPDDGLHTGRTRGGELAVTDDKEAVELAAYRPAPDRRME